MPLRLWSVMIGYALKLSGRALARRWPWLLVAPMVSILLGLLEGPASMLGIAGGFLLGFVYAAAGSLILYIGRGIIEQRRMDADDLTRGVGAFLGDVMNVLFLVWIVSLVGRAFAPLTYALYVGLVALPVFETVALTPVGGFSSFGSAWAFFRRDAGPWLLGQLPVLALMSATWRAGDYVPFGLWPTALFIAFIYRGVLFLTLDSVAPHARARKFLST